MSVDLLMITWNRFDYAKRTIDNLLSTNDDFRLYWWDNGSVDGVAEYIDKLTDHRIVRKHINSENVMQAQPTTWFLECSQAEIVGKIDDDTLVPQGWTRTIQAALESDKKLGMIGCWTFWPEDFERNAETAKTKIRAFGEHKIVWNLQIGGTAFLMRRELARQYLITSHDGTAFPIARGKMTVDGYYSGWYYPLIWAEHMDDPRSEFCHSHKAGGNSVTALSAKVRGFHSPSEFLCWIKHDADRILSEATELQIRRFKVENSLLWKVKNKGLRLMRRFIASSGNDR